MKKIFTTFLLITAIISLSFAEKVDIKTARKVATTHLSNTQAYVGGININLAYTWEKTVSSAFNPEIIEKLPLLYIFNIGDDNGIILVSGDDVASPILGYTTSGHFDSAILPNNFQKWIEGYKKQINYAIENETEAVASVKKQWKILINGKTIMNIEDSKNQNNIINMPVSKLIAGTYFVIVSTDKNVYHRKFIKK